MLLPYEQIKTPEEVASVIDDMAARIIEDCPDWPPLFVGLANGGVAFSVDLMRAIHRQNTDYHPNWKALVVSSSGDEYSPRIPVIKSEMDRDDVDEHHVLMIDDVIDKGHSAEVASHYLYELGAKSVKLAVLCDKPDAREADIRADYAGFKFGKNDWLVGMGMDDSKLAPGALRWEMGIGRKILKP